MKFIVSLLVFLLLCAVLALGIGFAAVNRTTVPLDLLVIRFGEHSVALWVVAAFAAGGVIGMLTNMGLVLRLRTSLMRANRKLRGLEKGLEKDLEKAEQKDAGEAAPKNALAQEKN